MPLEYPCTMKEFDEYVASGEWARESKQTDENLKQICREAHDNFVERNERWKDEISKNTKYELRRRNEQKISINYSCCFAHCLSFM